MVSSVVARCSTSTIHEELQQGKTLLLRLLYYWFRSLSGWVVDTLTLEARFTD